MKLALVSPCFPPARGGVAAHSGLLYGALSSLAAVERVDAGGQGPFSAGAVAERIRRAGCDGAVVQYTPNLYGWSNFFPWFLLKGLRKRRIPSLTLFHEIFMPGYGGGARGLLMRPVNSLKDWLCLKTTDFPAVTLSWRARALDTLFRLKARVIPVFSNLPLCAGAGVKKEFLFAVFGTYHPDLRLDRILKVLSLFHGEKALFIGQAPASAAAHPQAEVTGWLPPDGAASALHRARFFVMFDKRGISFRKGSSAAALLNGIPVVANRTPWTDPEFRDGENVALYDGTEEGLFSALCRLKGDPALCVKIAGGGRDLYDRHLSVETAAQRIVDAFKGKPR